MYFQSAGQGNPPVLFVHGFACDLSDWRAQRERLQGETTVVACDLRGHGATPGLPEDCSVETYGADVASLLAGPTILVGHSMGCRVVLQAYRNATERVAGIVLLDGSCVASGERAEAEENTSQQLSSQGYDLFVRRFFEEMFLPDSDPILKAGILERALRLPAEIGAPLFARLAGWDAAEVRPALDSVRVPLLAIQTTFVNSERVRVPLAPGQSSPWLELLREHAPDAHIVALSGHGHFAHVEKPEEVNELIADFVSGLRV